MTKFSDLSVGDVFNTKSGRFVKVNDTTSMSIIDNGLFQLAELANHSPDLSVIPLYMAISQKCQNFSFDDIP